MKILSQQDLNNATFREGDVVELDHTNHKITIKQIQTSYPYGKMRIIFSVSMEDFVTGKVRDIIYVDDELFVVISKLVK
jgi:translation elongation factor P/translation initiation factor 5A